MKRLSPKLGDNIKMNHMEVAYESVGDSVFFWYDTLLGFFFVHIYEQLECCKGREIFRQV